MTHLAASHEVSSAVRSLLESPYPRRKRRDMRASGIKLVRSIVILIGLAGLLPACSLAKNLEKLFVGITPTPEVAGLTVDNETSTPTPLTGATPDPWLEDIYQLQTRVSEAQQEGISLRIAQEQSSLDEAIRIATAIVQPRRSKEEIQAEIQEAINSFPKPYPTYTPRTGFVPVGENFYHNMVYGMYPNNAWQGYYEGEVYRVHAGHLQLYKDGVKVRLEDITYYEGALCIVEPSFLYDCKMYLPSEADKQRAEYGLFTIQTYDEEKGQLHMTAAPHNSTAEYSGWVFDFATMQLIFE